jgi:bile acid:Na+ symporter, BASS family
LSEQVPSIIVVCLNVSVFALLLAQGATVGPTDILLSLRKVRLLARTFVAAHLAVPLVTLLVLLILRPQHNVTIALAILASCPVAPLMILRISRATGRLAEVMALHFAITVFGLLAMPLTLHFMAQVLGFRADVNVADVLQRVSWMLIVPLAGGIGLRMVMPRVAAATAKLLGQCAGVLLAGLVVAITALMYQSVLQTNGRSYVTMTAFVAAALAAGHLISPRNPEEQLTLAMLSAGRHLGVALLIAATSFPSAKALPVLLPYLLVFLAVSTVYVRWRCVAIAGPRRCSDDNCDDDVSPFVLTGQHPLGVSP